MMTRIVPPWWPESCCVCALSMFLFFHLPRFLFPILGVCIVAA
jgi:hypothetical protein